MEYDTINLSNLTHFIMYGVGTNNEIESKSTHERLKIYNDEIENYLNLLCYSWENTDNKSKKIAVESLKFDFYNILNNLNRLYFEMGMKSGANLLSQLIVKD